MKKNIYPILLVVLLLVQLYVAVRMLSSDDAPSGGNVTHADSPFASEADVVLPPPDLPGDIVISSGDASLPPEASQTGTPEEVDLTQYASVLYSDTRFYRSASDKSAELGFLKKDEKVILLERRPDWYKVDSNGTVGWVPRSRLKIIRNAALEAQLYSPVPSPEAGKILDISGTATESYLSEIAAAYNTTGLSMAVIKDGQIAYHYEYGHADLKKSSPITQNTKFRVASVSKVFTSMLAMKLAEDGKLDIDADLNSILDYTVRNRYFKDEIITTRMLLSHTSSFVDKKVMYSSSVVNDVEDKDSYARKKPGTSFSYCNFGMGLAGAVIEKSSDMNLSLYAQQVFLTPMGIDAAYDGAYLKDTSDVADCIEVGRVSHSAEEITAPKQERELGYTVTLAAGGLLINSVDMARIVSILACSGQYDGVQYLSPETLEKIHTPQIDTKVFEQCLGVRRSAGLVPGRTVYFHPGCAYGVFSLIVYDPTDQSGAVIIATGASDYSDDLGIRRVCSDSLEYIYGDLIDG